ncbi:MAG: V-type ATP synthase subunit I [Candidatus Thorarchaeota archaeon]
MKNKSQMSLFKVSVERKYKDPLLYHLSKINSVHIKSKTKPELKRSSEDFTFSDKIKSVRQNLNTLFKKLRITESDFQPLKFKKEDRIKFDTKDLQELLKFVSEEIDFFHNRAVELEKYITRAHVELDNLKSIKNCYYFLDKFNLNIEVLNVFKNLNIKAYTTFKKNLPNLRSFLDISQFPNVHQISQTSDDRISFFIIYPKDKEEDLKKRINLIHAEEVPILKKYLTHKGINFDRILKEIDLISNTLNKYIKEQSRIRYTNLLKFAAINEIVQNIEEYDWAERQFEELPSKYLSIKFFVPLNRKNQIIQYLNKNLGSNIIIESINIGRDKSINEINEFVKLESKSFKNSDDLDDFEQENYADAKGKDLREETPRIMKNFFLFRPFETLTKMYGTPSYSEIDPTPFLFFTFPLLFGLMFGDIGHGICLIIAGLIGAFVFRNKKGKDFSNYCWIIFWCGWGAVLAGFLYGEFFGMHEILGYELNPVTIYIPFLGFRTLHNPLDNIITIFIFVILIGVIHICLGWFIQFLNYWKQGYKYFAFSDSLCKILFLSGGTFLLFIWQFDINAWFSFPYPILLPLIPGLLLILLKPLGKVIGVTYLREETYSELIGEGSMETFETVLSVLSNVASYVRLLALALIHIALMLSIQAMIALINTGSIILDQILIVIGLIFGNLVVILLEGLLVFINALRLNFYEFFFKFYQGTGIDFFPFYLDDNYSVINFKIESDVDLISKEIEKEIESEKIKKDIDKAYRYISKKFF